MAHRRARELMARLTGKPYSPPWYSGLRPPRGVDVEERDRLQTWAIAEAFGEQHTHPDVAKLFQEKVRQRKMNDPKYPEDLKRQLAEQGTLITPEEERRALQCMSAWDAHADHYPPWVGEKVDAFRQEEPEAWLEQVLEAEAKLAVTAARKHELSPAEREVQETEIASLSRLLPLARQAAEAGK